MKHVTQRRASRKSLGCYVGCGCMSASFSSTGGTYSETIRSERLRHRGVVLVWVALLSLVLILFVGLSLDTAKVALAREFLKIIYHVLKEQREFYFYKKDFKIQSVAATALCGV